MKALIKEEFRKIFKKKSFLILLIALLLFSGYRTYSYYQKTRIHIADEENTQLKGIDALRYVDAKRHAYAGEIDQPLLDQFYKDYQEATQKVIETRTIDDVMMKESYGENYLMLMDKMEKGTLLVSELERELPPKGGSYTSENGYITDMDIFYKESAYLRGLNCIYYGIAHNGLYNNNIFDSDLAIDFVPLVDRERYKIKSDSEGIDPTLYHSVLWLNPDVGIDHNVVEYYNEKFMDVNNNFDSDLPNSFLIANMSDQTLMMLAFLLIVIILADMFSNDRQQRCDQIIETSQYGNRKLRCTKLIVGLLLSLGIILMQQAIIIIVSLIILPIHQLDLPLISSISMGNAANQWLQTYPELLLSACIMIPLAAIVIGMITMLLSYLIKNKFAVSIVMVLFITFGTFVSISSILSVNLNIDQFLPQHFGNFNLFHVIGDNLYPIGATIVPVIKVFSNMVLWRDIVALFWLLMSTLIFSFITFIKIGTVKNK